MARRRVDFKSEADLAAKVVSWLEADGWDVYQEVSSPAGRNDIVARRDGVVHVIECKLHANMQVLEQAWCARDYAHGVLVAVPAPSSFFVVMCDKLGVGIIEVCSWNKPRVRLAPLARPARQVDRLTDRLCPEQKEFAKAGTNGKFWTPFKGFARKVSEYVAKHPRGVTVKQAAVQKDLDHYATPASFRQCVPRLAQKGVFPGVRCVNIGGAWTLLPCPVGQEVDGRG